jgi:uncharacterized membrane protein YphA (DoxX/SURF4 family)
MIKKCKCKNLSGIVVGILFLFSGLMKLFVMTPTGFAENMLVPVLGVGAGLALLLSWLIVIVETLGGIALLLKCKVPSKIFKTLMIGLAIILVVAIIFVHLMGQDFMGALKDLVILSVIIPMVCHCSKGCHCSSKKCDKGVCTPKEVIEE